VIAGQAHLVEHQPRVSVQLAKRRCDGTGVRPDQADGEAPQAGHVFGSLAAPDPRVVLVAALGFATCRATWPARATPPFPSSG